MYEIKTEDIYQDFSNNKEIFDLSNCITMSKHYGDPNKLVIGKMQDEIARIAIEELVGLKPKKNSYLVNDNSEHKKERIA